MIPSLFKTSALVNVRSVCAWFVFFTSVISVWACASERTSLRPGTPWWPGRTSASFSRVFAFPVSLNHRLVVYAGSPPLRRLIRSGSRRCSRCGRGVAPGRPSQSEIVRARVAGACGCGPDAAAPHPGERGRGGAEREEQRGAEGRRHACGPAPPVRGMRSRSGFLADFSPRGSARCMRGGRAAPAPISGCEPLRGRVLAGPAPAGTARRRGAIPDVARLLARSTHALRPVRRFHLPSFGRSRAPFATRDCCSVSRPVRWPRFFSRPGACAGAFALPSVPASLSCSSSLGLQTAFGKAITAMTKYNTPRLAEFISLILRSGWSGFRGGGRSRIDEVSRAS